MKFAKELEQDLVPEWAAKYFDYKQAKKKIKAVARALRALNATPQFQQKSEIPTTPGEHQPYTFYDFSGLQREDSSRDSNGKLIKNAANPGSRPPANRNNSLTVISRSPPLDLPETQPLNVPTGQSRHKSDRPNYGSFIATPPKHASPELREPPQPPPQLELPDPALDLDKQKYNSPQIPAPGHHPGKPDAYHVGKTRIPHKMMQRWHAHRSPSPQQAGKRSQGTKKGFKRMLSGTEGRQSQESIDIPLAEYHELDKKQEGFFAFLDQQLEKIESFYKLKETDATKRLEVLRDQLHEMRDRRLDEIQRAKQGPSHDANDHGILAGLHEEGLLPTENAKGRKVSFLGPLEGVIGKHREPKVGRTTKAMDKLSSPTAPKAKAEDGRDYTRKLPEDNVPYHAARRKLKLALQEFYRALELLKSYAILNRTAFRKCNKKYDKAVNARPTMRYMNEKVSKAWFVQSDVIETHIVAVEDLYTRYFERGNRKIAVSKLRSKNATDRDFSQISFFNGLCVALATGMGIEGLVRAQQQLHDPDPAIAANTGYLLQLYAGYFLADLLFLIFALDCRLWHRNKINYPFVFEYDTRHMLDWRQLAALPCFFLLLNGLFLWINFTVKSSVMFIYWPVLLIVITLAIMLNPMPIMYPYSRSWWAFSNWRLFLAGLYPVEFRDFFLGDMYCSETYSMGNIEVFFCLYANVQGNNWHNPGQCNSSHSRLLGFFSALPAVWRGLQCLRRYYDSRKVFPHLVNFGKYSFNILYYMSLSLYRIHKTTPLRATFISFALVNAVYCSLWDVIMDWSLGDPYAPHPYLRDNIAIRQVWLYYFAMVADPILRFQWIFYAIFGGDLQHSALMGFLIALAEVLRRGLWTIFRVENEHCTNVGKYRASRDIPLPYSLPESPRSSQGDDGTTLNANGKYKKDDNDKPGHKPLIHSGDEAEHDLEANNATANTSSHSPTTPGGATSQGSLRLRKVRTPHDSKPSPSPGISALRRVATVIQAAHAEDFERKKRPGITGADSSHSVHDRESNSSDEDDEDNEDAESEDREIRDVGDIGSEEEEILKAQRMASRGQS